MTQKYYTTRRKKFQHLTKEKRAQLEILLKMLLSNLLDTFSTNKIQAEKFKL